MLSMQKAALLRKEKADQKVEAAAAAGAPAGA
jgi:hypothetical protein